MRVAIGQLWFETDGFNPLKTTLRDFEAMGIFYGDEILKRFRGVGELGGFIKAAEEEGVELAPTMRACAWPGGYIDRETHRFLRDRFLEELRRVGEVDGILLSLHGAMSAEDEYDVEGTLLEDIRREWGWEIPISVAFDHHGNMTNRIIKCINALTAYHTEPHVDLLETGYKAAKILFAAIRGEVEPVIRWRKLPMIAMGDLRVPEGPLGAFFKRAKEYEEREDVLSVSIFPENPYVDSPELGWSVVAVTDNDPELAQRIADELAGGIWEKRYEFLPRKEPSPAEAVELALKIEGGPVVLSDWSDATNSGAPGDSTAILIELLKRRDKLRGKALLTIVDPEAVEECVKAGIGKVITLEVGGKIGTRWNKPVKVTGVVRRITDGKFVVEGPSMKGFVGDMGRTAVLEVGNINIVLCEKRAPGHDPALYRSVGLEPKDAKIVVVKSPMSFRAAYEPFAKKIIIVHGPGAASPYLETFEYRNLRRPIFPLDPDIEFKI